MKKHPLPLTLFSLLAAAALLVSASGAADSRALAAPAAADPAPAGPYFIDNPFTQTSRRLEPGLWLPQVSPAARVPALPPVVFVRGFGGFPPQIFGCEAHHKTDLTPPTYTADDGTFRELPGLLQAAGYQVFFARLVTNHCYSAPLQVNAGLLKTAINYARAQTGADKVILIAHSMGGIVSRTYIENDSLYQGDVSGVFTFGSPHFGVGSIVLKILAKVTYYGSLGAFCILYGPAACEISDEGMAIFNLQHAQRRLGVSYTTVSGDMPLYTRSVYGQIMNILMAFVGNDGLVRTSSGAGLAGVGVTHTTDENHNLFGNTDYQWDYFGVRHTVGMTDTHSKSYTQCLQPMLINRAAQCTPSAAGQALTAELPPPFSEAPQLTPLVFDNLLPGQSATHTLPLEGGPALIAASWLPGAVTFTLQDPNGLTIDAAFANAHPGLVTYTEQVNAAIFQVSNALPGNWQYRFTALPVPLLGVRVGSFAAVESPLHFSAAADRTWYTPGDTAVFSATFSAPVLTPTVQAVVFRSDGVSETVDLAPTGGPASTAFRGQYTVPDVPGHVELSFISRGTYGAGLAFLRGAEAGFQVSPQSIALDGGYGELAVPREPGSPFYSALQISVTATTVVSGSYNLSADLVDSSGQLVGHALVTQELQPGAAVFTLSFPGIQILASRRSGPYHLTNLLLTDVTQGTLAAAAADDVYTTQAYPYWRFGADRHSLPLVSRPGSPTQARR